MVAFPVADSGSRSQRFAEMISGADVSGEASDHAWMAGALAGVADVLDPGGEDRMLEPLLAAAHLAGLNEPRAARRLRTAFGLSEASVTAMRELLRAASLSPEGWQLLRMEVCRFERARGGARLRWEIDGQKLAEVSRIWHELGERVMFRRLVRAFCRWIAYREGNVEVVIRRAPAEAGPRWVGELRGALAQECGEGRLRVEPLIAWEGAEVKTVRSECRRGALGRSVRSREG